MQLEELLGEELYTRVKAKIDEKNAKETDKLKHVRYADLSEGGYVSKAKYDTDLAEKKNLEEQIKTLNGTIKELQDNNKDNTQLQSTIEQLKKDLAQKQTENLNMVKTYALKEQLAKAGVLDADYLIYRHGGIDKFNFDKDNNPIGVEDTIKPYKADTTMAHLFKTEEKKPPYSPTGGSGGNNKNPFAKDTYNMTEQAQLFKTNPEQARAMAAAAGVTI
jgi:TolA-binding protein